MKTRILNVLKLILLLLIPGLSFAQAPPMGTAADFVIFTTIGAVGNTGISHLTGNVGTNNGDVTGFGNVNGVMAFASSPKSALCAADLLIAYNQLNSTVPDYFPAPLLGNGDTLIAGVYSITGATTLNLSLTLNAQGNPNAVFIFKIQGPFSTNANSKIKLINGAQACKVFWKVEGLVDMATGTTMRGTVIANNAAINMNSGDTLEGRLLSTNGAINVSGVLAYTPIGCGSPALTGPLAPSLVSAECYAIFSSNGPVTNVGITHITGDVGTNVGLTSGFNPLFVTGAIHPIPDGSTVAAAADLLNAFSYLNILPYDIELLYPAQFGNQLVLTPHTYLMNGAVTFTDTVFLNALGDANAVFVIKIYGAISTSTYSKVKMINGTQSKNVYWLVNGAVTINDYSEFVGTIVCNNGAMNLNTGVKLDGRALTTNGALSTSAITAIMPPGCGASAGPVITTEPVTKAVCAGDSVKFSVSATGSALTYQWRKGNVNLINGGNILGTTSDTLKIYPVNISNAAANYNVIVSGTVLPNDTSINVSLVVNTPPVITTEPVNKTACIGSSVNFSVISTGTNLTYQWRKGNVNIVNGGNISGATSDTLRINSMLISDTAINYNVIVSGSCLPKDTSINVSLLRTSPPIITLEPINKTVCAGSSVNFSVTATGAGLTYQWRKGNVNLINSINITGVNSNTLTINPVNVVDAAANYNVIVYGSCSPNDTSINVSLVVNTPPIITTEPVNKTACIGNSVSFSVISSGTNLTYQWRKGNVNIVNGGNISGATSDTLRINPLVISDTASDYNVIVSGSCLPEDTSINVSLLKASPPIITVEPINKTICAGSSVNFSVTATGTGLTYQWRKGTINLINSVNITGVNTNTLTINPVNVVDIAANYNVIVYGSCSPNDTSVNVSLAVNTATIITTQPVNKSVCVGNSVYFSVVATGIGNTYQWRKGNINILNGGNISGATSDTLKINFATILDTASNYNVVVTGLCSPINSLVVNLKSAGEFGILSGVGISSTGFSVISDMNIGISPGVRSSVTGFPPATIVNGAIYASDDVAPPGVAAMLIQAKQDLTDAYLFAEGATAPAPVTVAGDQGGKTLAPGIYKSTSTLLIQSGDLTLDAQGNANAVWIFQIASDFTTVGGAGGNVILSGGAQAKNIIWQVGSSATIGNGTIFKGNILALTSITMNTGSSIDGRLLARNGAVVLSGTNIINSPSNNLANTSVSVSNNASLIVNPLPLTSAITGNATPICSSIGQIYSVVNTPGSTYVWTVPAGAIITSGGGTNSITVNFGILNGNIKVKETNSNGCIGIQVVKLILLSGCGLNADFDTDITSVCSGSSVIFTNISTGTTITTTYNWNFGANATPLTAVGIGPHIVTYTGAGSNTVSLTIADGIPTSTKTVLNYISIIPNNTIVLSSAIGTNNQTKCINTAITNITYTTTGATGVTFSGLPVGVTGSWLANVVTISGTPTISGSFNYTVNLTGSCGIVSATGTITVSPNNTIVLSSAIGTNNQSKCINIPITNITYTTTNATGATFSGLPAGVTGTWLANVVTISGTPTLSGIFNYTVNLTGGCGIISATGTITVSPNNTIVLSSAIGTNNQTKCINTAITNITYTTTNATGATFSGLPAGVTGNWLANVVTISGTPTTSGSFNYTVNLTGGCGIISAAGTITVSPNNTIVLSSAIGTNNQTKCINTAITNITYTTTNATGATFSGLPVGVTGSWLANVVTISGTPTLSGSFNYTVNLTGGCGIISAIGTITVSPDNTIVLSSAIGTNNQTKCINTAITNITYTTTNATGATFSGLPVGVTGSWLANVVTISGTPTVSGSFNYTVNLTGGCGIISATGTITVSPNNTIVLSSAIGTNNQTKCINTAITNITYTTTGAISATFSGLPAGVTGSWLANVVTISGTPTLSGIFNYTVNLTGGCGIISATGTITVSPNNTIVLSSAVGTNNQTKCINTAITNITYTTTNATGATFSGLPVGVTGSWLANVVTISGTPTLSGSFNYTVNLTGGCGIISAIGTITVSPDNTIVLSSAIGTNNQTKCINTAITNITYTTTGATGATFSGLPVGVTGSWLANVVTISGTPTASGSFNYTINLIGGCGIISATGTITVSPNNTIVLSSAIGTNNQTKCINTAITNITYTTTNATGATFSGLPAGVTGSWLANVVTISGTPTLSGSFNYTVNLTGGCGIISAIGTITVSPNNTIVLSSAIGTNNQTKCINTAITNITYTTIGATGATFSGLPVGVTGSWLANVVTISGTPTASGSFNYTINLIGGCGIISATGTITVSPNNTIVLSSAIGTNNQTKCINTAITNITYTTIGATGATFSGLPVGVTGSWLANVVTISGTPTASGSFNYTINLIGGCGIISATGTITVSPNNTIVLSSAIGTNNQTKCINTAITNITYTTTGATGATFSGLPVGVTGSWLANVVTISGTPTLSGSFNYTVNLTGGCGIVSATGTITINPITGVTVFTLGAVSLCQNAADEIYTATASNSNTIVYSVLPATAGVINPTTGVMNWAAGFSGTATITATSTGFCGITTADRIVTIKPLPIAIASSNSPVCVNSSIILSAQTVVGGTYAWTGPNSFSTSVQNPVITSVTTADAGNYNLSITLNGCTSVPSSIAVVVDICPADLAVVKTVNIIHPLIGTNVVFTIVATNNGPHIATAVSVTDILQSGYTFVSATANSIGQYNSLTGICNIGTLNSGASNIIYITATVNSTGSYVNAASIIGNEVDLNLANNVSTIETDPTDFFIPQGFSPNGDGINDLFVIRGIEIFPANTILIFNRWGNKVFEASPYQNTWDGTSKMGLQIGGDDKLPIGTYFYLLNLGDNSDVIKGTIYLNR